MSTEPSNEKLYQVLAEIRDLLKSREQKYEEYLQRADQRHNSQVKNWRSASWLYLLWLICGVTSGVFLGELMLRIVLNKP